MTERALRPGVVFYTVTDARHFIGAVGLINSLRLSGHNHPIVLTDLGLTEQQRRLLEGVVEILDADSEVPGVLAKPLGPLEQPAEVMVVLDADVLVVRSLDPLIDEARAGRLASSRTTIRRASSRSGNCSALRSGGCRM